MKSFLLVVFLLVFSWVTWSIAQGPGLGGGMYGPPITGTAPITVTNGNVALGIAGDILQGSGVTVTGGDNKLPGDDSQDATIKITDGATENDVKIWKSGAWVNRYFSTGLVVGASAITVDDTIFSPLGPTIGNSASEFNNPTTFGSNRVDMGDTELELPHGASMSLTELGEMTLDTTQDQVVYYGAQSWGQSPTYVRALDPRLKIRARLEAPQNSECIFMDAATHDMIPLEIKCITPTASSTAPVTIKECTATGGSCTAIHDAAVSCDDDQQVSTSFNATGALIDDGDWIQLCIGTTTGSPAAVTIVLEYTASRQ